MGDGETRRVFSPKNLGRETENPPLRGGEGGGLESLSRKIREISAGGGPEKRREKESEMDR